MRSKRNIGQILEKNDNVVSCRPKFDPERFRELLVEAIILHDLPFQFVEYEGIRTLFDYLRPETHVVSRNTVKADVFKMFDREKLRTKVMISACSSRINLTSNCWSSIVNDGYISLTCHFIDNDWILQKRILNFSFMPLPHNGETLGEKIYDLCCEWGIEKKLCGLTLDNASSNDTCVEKLIKCLNDNDAIRGKREFFHLRCCAHIINLVVQDGLKDIDTIVGKIRDSIKFVKGSSAKKQQWLNYIQMDMNSTSKTKKGLRQDIPTKWNSTYYMLESALCYRKAFEHMAFIDETYKYCPTSDEWEKIDSVCGFLSLFYKLTEVFSRTKYPTANLYFFEVTNCYMVLKDKTSDSNEYIRKMAAQMLPKFEKYWSEFRNILCIAAVFDPRYKLQLVDFIYNEIYGHYNSSSYQDVKTKLFEVFSEYSKDDCSSQVSASSNINMDDSNDHANPYRKKEIDLVKSFIAFVESSVPLKSQLELYLEEPRLNFKQNSKLDVLAYWKENQYRYPIVATMARDILSISVTTVASKDAFSVCERVLDQYHTQLLPSTVEAIICTKDWLFGDKENKSYEELCEDITSEVTTEADSQNSNNNDARVLGMNVLT